MDINLLAIIILILSLAVYLTYIISCLVNIKIIYRHIKKSDRRANGLAYATLAFTCFCLFGIFVYHLIPIHGMMPITIFLYAEITYLLYINSIAISNKKLRAVFTVFLAICYLLVPFFYNHDYAIGPYYPIFVFESLIASSISFVYFNQISKSISTKNLLQDPLTLIVLGIFFCYSLPFVYNSTLTVLSAVDSNFISEVNKRKTNILILVFLAQIGTLCYLAFNIFVYKAYK